MNVSKFARIAGCILGALAVFWIWYTIAADYDYGALSGTYTLRSGGETSTLVLRADRTFEQELIRNGSTRRAQGTWRRFGEGGVSFSGQFLGREVESDGEVYGQVEKTFLELIPTIVFGPDDGGPRFTKRLFH